MSRAHNLEGPSGGQFEIFTRYDIILRSLRVRVDDVNGFGLSEPPGPHVLLLLFSFQPATWLDGLAEAPGGLLNRIRWRSMERIRPYTTLCPDTVVDLLEVDVTGVRNGESDHTPYLNNANYTPGSAPPDELSRVNPPGKYRHIDQYARR